MADKWSDVLDNLIEAQVSGYETMRLDCSDVEALLAAAREAEALRTANAALVAALAEVGTDIAQDALEDPICFHLRKDAGWHRLSVRTGQNVQAALAKAREVPRG